jgi:hypothetical protein
MDADIRTVAAKLSAETGLPITIRAGVGLSGAAVLLHAMLERAGVAG